MDHDAKDPHALIARIAKGYALPGHAFAPTGSWTHCYADRSSFNLTNQGTLTIERKAVADGHRLIARHIRSCIDGYVFLVSADLECRGDAISTPVRWAWESKVARSANDAPFLQSGLKGSAILTGKTLQLTNGPATRRLELTGRHVCKWCLLEAVQRLPAARTEPVTFALIDEYDEVGPEAVLRYRDTVQLAFKEGAAEVHCYEQWGGGALPRTFWVDAMGRLLFVLAGMQLLVLVQENDAAIPFNPAGAPRTKGKE